MAAWPTTHDELVRLQATLGRKQPPAWQPPEGDVAIAGCFVCFPRGLSGAGEAGDPAWAAAALLAEGRSATTVVSGRAGGPYEPGLLALRAGPLLERALRALPGRADVVLVNATGRDHPRRAGLALHLGAVLELPTIGVTHRPLLASGEWPGPEPGEQSPLLLDGSFALGREGVGAWLRTQRGRRPLAVHAAWRTTPDTAVEVVRRAIGGSRTPEPLRLARQAARVARAQAGSGVSRPSA